MGCGPSIELASALSRRTRIGITGKMIKRSVSGLLAGSSPLNSPMNSKKNNNNNYYPTQRSSVEGSIELGPIGSTTPGTISLLKELVCR